MRKLLIILMAAGAILGSTPASANLVEYDGSSYRKCLDPKGEAPCDFVQRVIHDAFHSHTRAHRVIGYFSCESGLYRDSRRHDASTQYKGIASAGAGFRRSYPSGPEPWGWRVRVQIRAARDAIRASVAAGHPPFAQWGQGESWGCA